jgi:hypothetical protein
LAVVWSIFRFCGHDRVVILNEEQNPLGFLSLRDLLSVSGDFPEASGPWQKGLWEWENQLWNRCYNYPAIGRGGLFAPIYRMKNNSKSMFLLSPPEKPIALVNGPGQFLGLLDSVRVFFWNFIPLVRPR